jgi:hypothetical protein
MYFTCTLLFSIVLMAWWWFVKIETRRFSWIRAHGCFFIIKPNSICSCSKAVYKSVWHIPLLSVQWINSWWWAQELSETSRVSCQNKFGKLVHLHVFITKKFVMMHGHTNVKKKPHGCVGRIVNHLTPNDHFSGRTAPLTYRGCIFYLFNKYTYWIF